MSVNGGCGQTQEETFGRGTWRGRETRTTTPGLLRFSQPDSFAQVIHHSKSFGVHILALLRPPRRPALRPVNKMAVAEDGIQNFIKTSARRFAADRGRHQVAGEGDVRRSERKCS